RAHSDGVPRASHIADRDGAARREPGRARMCRRRLVDCRVGSTTGRLRCRCPEIQLEQLGHPLRPKSVGSRLLVLLAAAVIALSAAVGAQTRGRTPATRGAAPAPATAPKKVAREMTCPTPL